MEFFIGGVVGVFLWDAMAFYGPKRWRQTLPWPTFGIKRLEED